MPKATNTYPMKLWCDTETRSAKPLAHGSWAYAEQAEVTLFTWAVDDGPVDLWDLTEDPAIPQRLADALRTADEIWFSNGGGFDWPVLMYSRPDVYALMPQHKWRDVLVQAYSHALPGSLDKLGRVLKLSDDQAKDKRGRALINLFCKPRKDGGWNDRRSHPAEWEEFKVYARQDIVTMRECSRRMPMWNYRQRDVDLWLTDWRTNARGICVDVELAHAAVETARHVRRDLSDEMVEATDGAVRNATQRDALLEHLLSAHGVELEDLKKSTVADLLDDDELDPAVRHLLELRQQASLNSPAKFRRVINGANTDGRIRGCMQFRGAGRTGRAAHRLLQPGNMARPKASAEHIEDLIGCTKAGALSLVHDKPMEALRDQVRGVIIAGKGRKLVVADLANIEGRGMAWLAHEEWKLRAFREYDAGHGHDLYILAYATAFAVDPATVPKKGLERQIGKVCIAAGQRVLTDTGLVPIERVTTEMRVWDGVEWVKHEGVLFSGMKEVMTYQGLTATPDHKVFIDGETAVPLADAAARGQRIVQSGAGRRPLRVVGSDRAGAPVHAGVERPVRSNEVHGVRLGVLGGAIQHAPREEHGMFGVRASAEDPPMAVATARLREEQVHESERPGLAPVRRAGDPVRVRGADRGGVVPDRDLRAAEPRDGDRSSGQQRALRAGEPAVGDPGREPSQQKEDAVCAVGSGGMAVQQEPGVAPAEGGDDPSRNSCGCLDGRGGEAEELAGHPRKVAVFDIVNAGPRRRFTVENVLVSNCELMMQYEGGVGAFVTGALTYRIDLEAMSEQAWPTIPEWAKDGAAKFLDWKYSEIPAKTKDLQAAREAARLGLSERVFMTCDALKRLWRAAHPGVVGFWADIKEALTLSVNCPGETFPCRRVKFRRDGNWLRIGLPSGRALCYPEPKIDEDGQFSYSGVDQRTRKWTRVKSYSGKVAENLTQGMAADQMFLPSPAIEAAGYLPVLHVHDEWVTETPDSDAFNADTLGAMMCMDLGWNKGLPLAAAGFEATRYKKDG